MAALFRKTLGVVWIVASTYTTLLGLWSFVVAADSSEGSVPARATVFNGTDRELRMRGLRSAGGRRWLAPNHEHHRSLVTSVAPGARASLMVEVDGADAAELLIGDGTRDTVVPLVKSVPLDSLDVTIATEAMLARGGGVVPYGLGFRAILLPYAILPLGVLAGIATILVKLRKRAAGDRVSVTLLLLSLPSLGALWHLGRLALHLSR